MAALTFCKWSPCGNTTLLFPACGLDAARQARLAAAALDAACLGGAGWRIRAERARKAGDSLRSAPPRNVAVPFTVRGRPPVATQTVIPARGRTEPAVCPSFGKDVPWRRGAALTRPSSV